MVGIRITTRGLQARKEESENAVAEPPVSGAQHAQPAETTTSEVSEGNTAPYHLQQEHLKQLDDLLSTQSSQHRSATPGQRQLYSQSNQDAQQPSTRSLMSSRAGSNRSVHSRRSFKSESTVFITNTQNSDDRQVQITSPPNDYLHKSYSAASREKLWNNTQRRSDSKKGLLEDPLVQSLLTQKSLKFKQTTLRQASERTATTVVNESARRGFEYMEDSQPIDDGGDFVLLKRLSSSRSQNYTGSQDGIKENHLTELPHSSSELDDPQSSMLVEDESDVKSNPYHRYIQDPSLELGASDLAAAGSGSFRVLDSSEQLDASTRKLGGEDGETHGQRPSYKRKRSKKACWDGFLDEVQRFRDVCGALVNNGRVQLVMVMLIVINAAMMGIATFGFVNNNPTVNRAFQNTDKAFLIVFTIELGMQLVYHGRYLFLDGWLLFDFLIVVMSWSFESLQVVRSFRIFRAFRLITRLDVLKNLVTALFAVAPSMGAIVALLILVFYIYSVMCTVLFGTMYDEGYLALNYFGRLDNSLFTLFQMMTLEGWADIVRQVMVKYYWAWAVFSSYLIMTSFMLYSLIIAVVCDAVKVTEHQGEKDEEIREEGEMHERVMLLEQQIADMAQQQFMIVENLHIAMQALEALDAEDENVVSENELESFERSFGEGESDLREQLSRTDRLLSNERSASMSRLAPQPPDRPDMSKQYASTSQLLPSSTGLIIETDGRLATVTERAYSDASLGDAAIGDLHGPDGPRLDVESESDSGDEHGDKEGNTRDYERESPSDGGLGGGPMDESMESPSDEGRETQRGRRRAKTTKDESI